MHESSRLAIGVSSPAERGGEFISCCSPCGSQRTVAAPRSNAACPARRVLSVVAVRDGFQGNLQLSGKLSAASRFCFLSPRKPNPAFERPA
jgi:hypothetical protein